MPRAEYRRANAGIGWTVSGPGFYSWQLERREARAWGRDLGKVAPGNVSRALRARGPGSRERAR
jgi:hypothetical protein